MSVLSPGREAVTLAFYAKSQVKGTLSSEPSAMQSNKTRLLRTALLGTASALRSAGLTRTSKQAAVEDESAAGDRYVLSSL